MAPALEAICRKALALEPEGRYATVEALKADLERWLADEPVLAWRDPWTIRAARWVRRHRTLVASTAAALVFGLAGLAGIAVVLAGKNRELDVKNLELAGKNQQLDRTNVALEGTNRELARERERAIERESLAIEALKKFRDAVKNNDDLKNRPDLDSIRKTLLNEPP